ncbi:sugar kinase [Microbacterium sorbitolivorans]|uniref:ROK family transcriptional regulator n=1 Tax=Microbacterium sorbitolivorans TaxID=1867410 RepID=A0A367XUF5_9MICO|nr:ROK family transcriptional regulator [Microbacterium sorbitolivorans]RCK57224.1 ROK family transcriptional regulator [Microbacterium sorbitolivorans]GGF45639.1 sugar kinase [Microbacterium sorbitolivorans]
MSDSASVDIAGLAPAVKAALLEVLIHGELPRAEIARRLNLSRASLTRITRTLVDAGLLAEGGTRLMAQTGRPSEMLILQPQARHVLGIKLTGDVLYATVTDLSATAVASRELRLPSPDPADVVAEIAGVAREFSAEYPDIVAVGIAIAGRVRQDRAGAVVEVSAFLDWTDVPLGAMVTEATGLPCSVENDVRALTVTEHWFGAGTGLDDMALITVGVGIGCGLVVNGRLVEGAHARAGQLSHLIVDDAGPYCDLGHRGCATSMLVNSAIVGAYRVAGVDYEGVVAAARAGDAVARAIFADAGRALGVLVASVANLTDPQKIVLTGDGIAVVELAGDAMRAEIARRLDTEAVDVDIDVRLWDFSEWARAGAGLAIRDMLS